FLVKESLIHQTVVFAGDGLERVLQAEDFIRSLTGLFLSTRCICPECLGLSFVTRKTGWIQKVTIGLELRSRQTPLGGTWMAGHEDEITFIHTARVPLQVVFASNRLSVFISAKHREIDVITGVGEVIRIASEESRLLFGRENQADIGIFLVTI